MSPSRGIYTPSHEGIGLNGMLMISLAIHILILSSGAFLRVSSTPRMTFGPIYSVQLVNMPSSLMASTPVSSLSKDITKVDSKDRAAILRKPSDVLLKVPIQKLESSTSRNPQVDQALERIKKKAAVETPSTAQGGTPHDGQSSADGNAKFNDYYRTIWAKIKSQWALPGGILPKGNLETIVHARILRNGSLTDIGIEKRSGNAYFDNSALRAVNKSNPLPSLPEWFRESSLDVGIRFHSAELL
jgi:colicin import membrane protein